MGDKVPIHLVIVTREDTQKAFCVSKHLRERSAFVCFLSRDLLERYSGLKEGLVNELLGDGNRYMDKYEAGYSFPTILRFKCTKCLFAACQNF